MSKSKKHHFIPQWQSKFWADENDRVNVVDRRNRNQIKSYTSHAIKVFSHKYLYSIRNKLGDNDDRLETQVYGPLDTEANDLTFKVLSILNSGGTPKMNYGARTQFWQFYFYNAFKRHPDSLTPFIDKLDYKALRQSTFQNAINRGEDKETIQKIFDNYDLKTHIETSA